MRFDTGRLSAANAAFMVAALIACRPAARNSPADSTKPPARADSAPTSSAPLAPRADSIVLRTDRAQYRAGEKLTLTLENKSAASYTFNPCTRSLERQDGTAWSAVPDEGRICTMEAWVLDPHGTRSGATELPSPLAPGRYRVAVRLVREQTGGAPAAAVTAVSDPITIS